MPASGAPGNPVFPEYWFDRIDTRAVFCWRVSPRAIARRESHASTLPVTTLDDILAATRLLTNEVKQMRKRAVIFDDHRAVSLKTAGVMLEKSWDWVRDHLHLFPNKFRLGAEYRIPIDDIHAVMRAGRFLDEP